MKLSGLGYECSTEGEWGIADSPNTLRAALWTEKPGNKVQVTVFEAHPFSLLFLKHPWSGECEITHNGRGESYDLYSTVEDGEITEIPFAAGTHQLTVTVKQTSNTQARANQVWFLGMKIAERLHVVERGRVLTPHTRLIEGDWGSFLTLRTDTGVAEALAKHGVWAKHDIELFNQHVPTGGVVLDIGANFGHHTVAFAKMVGPGGLVLAFEPQQVMFQLLNANLILNGVRNARVRQFALGDSDTSLKMFPISYDDFVNFGSLGINTSKPGEDIYGQGEYVQAFRLDNVLLSLMQGFDRLDFIKIDVQSYELFVLKGAKEVLRLYRPTLFLEVAPVWMKRTGYDYNDIYQYLLELDYRIYHPSDPTLPVNTVKDWDGVTDREWDILAVHSSKSEAV